MEEILFITEFQICPEESPLQKLLNEGAECSSDSAYKKLIDKILELYLAENDVYTRNVLVEFYTLTNTRRNLRRYFFEKVNHYRIGELTLFETLVDNLRIHIRDDLDCCTFNLPHVTQILQFLHTYLVNIEKADHVNYLKLTLPLYLLVLEAFYIRYETENIDILDLAVRQLILVTPRNYNEHFIDKALRVLQILHKLFKMDLKFETASKCGLVFAIFLNHLPMEEREQLLFKNIPIVEFLRTGKTLLLKSYEIENFFQTDELKTVLFLGIFATLPRQTLLDYKVGRNSLYGYLYLHLTTLGIKLSNHAELIVQISRTVEELTRIMPNVSFLIEAGLEFCWVHLDHFVENVVSFAKSIFVKIFEKYDQKEIFRILNGLQIFSKIRVNALHALSEVYPDRVLDSCDHIQKQLLTCIASATYQDIAGQIYVNLMQSSLLNDSNGFQVWINPILEVYRKLTMKNWKIFETIVTFAFKLKPMAFTDFFNTTVDVPSGQILLLMKCVHNTRRMGIFINHQIKEEEAWRKLIHKQKMELFMVHYCQEVRMAALQAVVECQKSTEAFIQWELAFFLRFFEINISSQHPNFRSRFLVFYKKIFRRLRASRNDENAERYDAFLRDFRLLVIQNFEPDANFSRRVLSLSVFLELLEFGTIVMHTEDLDNLKLLLNDGFESNKIMAVEILNSFRNQMGICAEDYYTICLEMVRDIRPSKNLTAAYMFMVLLQARGAPTRPGLIMRLVGELEGQMTRKMDLEAAAKKPVYGLLFTIRNLLHAGSLELKVNPQIYSPIHSRLVAYCLKLKSSVLPVVCALSPEGNIPDDAAGDDSAKAQVILVFAWKTVKEMMLLLAKLIVQSIELEGKQELLTVENYVQIGQLFMEIFLNTKHRGVFEQAHVAFSAISRSLLFSKNETIRKLPQEYLDEGLQHCMGIKTGSLCPTRRSAGLPFLILSIIPALVEVTRANIQKKVYPIIEVSREGNPEFRIHALNVLRFLFNNSKLSDKMVVFANSGTITAILGVKSPVWGVRNAATLLFSTLVAKMFGPSEPYNRITLAVFGLRYKALFEFLLNTLREESGNSESLVLYPILLILSRLYPSYSENIYLKVRGYAVYVDLCLKNPTYRTREFASRASMALVSESAFEAKVIQIFAKVAETTSDMERQGLLLQKSNDYPILLSVCGRPSKLCNSNGTLHFFHKIHPFLEKVLRNLSDLIYVEECKSSRPYKVAFMLQNLIKEFPITAALTPTLRILTQRKSLTTHTLYLDLIFMLFTKFRYFRDSDLFKKILHELRTPTLWSEYQVVLIILLTRFQQSVESYDFLRVKLLPFLETGSTEDFQRCMKFLIYLNQVTSQERFNEHPLLVAEEVEISPMTKTLIHSLDANTRRRYLVAIHGDLHRFFSVHLTLPVTAGNAHILVFLLLRFYPCWFIKFPQSAIDWLLGLNYSEAIQASVVICLKCLVGVTSVVDLRTLDFRPTIRFLMKSASPQAADYRRLATAQFLVDAHILFTDVLTEYDRYNILNVVMVLLEDDEYIVRDTISLFVGRLKPCPLKFFHCSPCKSREIFFETLRGRFFSTDIEICLLASWAIRHVPATTLTNSAVYESGGLNGLNSFSENIPITKFASSILSKWLWTLDESLSYADRSIYLEEQALLVTRVLLNALMKIPSPMVAIDTKFAVITTLNFIIYFLEEQPLRDSTFIMDFRIFFDAKVLMYLGRRLTTDYPSVKTFFTYMYRTILE